MGQLLVDLQTLDLSRDVIPEAELRAMVPQRDTFQLLDGVCHLDLEEGLVVAYKQWDADPWWAKAHIPGRPLMPGVLMIEGGAQTASVLIKRTLGLGPERFIGLGGLNDVRFRGQVAPPARIYFVSRVGQTSGLRLARYPAQAFCNGQMVMEMEVLGVPL